jgi:Ni/Fe-hydrogenase subunit HybB-like protein
VLALVVAVGVVAWVIQLRDGLGVAGYNDHAFWAVYIADVVTFIGVSYGGAVISAILRLTGANWRAPLSRLAEGTAVVTVLIGGAFIIPHLGRPERVWELVTRPNLSSPIFWDFVAVSTYTVGSIVFFALPLLPDMALLRASHGDRLGRRRRGYAFLSRGWVGAPRQRAVLQGALGLTAIMIIPLAVSVHSVLSWAFALVSRPWWHESIWAPYFVVAALYSGVALVILVVAGFRRAYHLESFISERHFVRLGFILATFAAAYLYLTFADILPDAYVGEPDSSAVFHALLIGHFAVWFWIFIVAAGILPLLLVAVRRTRTVTGMVTAAAIVVPAMWLKRMLMVLAPATFDRVTRTFGAYHFTWIPIAITLAGLAAIPLLLMLLFRVVPLLSLDEMAESGEGVVARPADRVDAVPRPRSPENSTDDIARPRRNRLFRITGAAGLLIVAVTCIGVVTAGSAKADAPSSPVASAAPSAPAVLTVAAAETANGVQLSATLQRADGTPVEKATVRFFEVTTEFGPAGQLVPITSATTDAAGSASVFYRPATAGARDLVAQYVDSAGAKVTGKAAVIVKTGYSTYRSAPPKPFAGIGKGLVGTALVAVVLILATLLIQVARVARVCRRGGRVDNESMSTS